MSRKLILPGGILWLSGLLVSIIGMNIKNEHGSLIAVIGNVMFFVGLAIVAAAWLIARRNEENKPDEEKREE
ncbi:MAG: hypothetical protein IJQ71_00790 [Clostridia bacterium]|jgi:amino acid transporter|nr:hypothetical protein [Clostridia bacterium]